MNTHQAYNTLTKTVIVFLTMILMSVSAYSQTVEPVANIYDDTTAVATDSTSTTSTDSQTKVVVVKPYERIALSIDSVTNLIAYNGVVEQEDSGSDSLYLRAKRFAEEWFGNSNSVFELEKRGQKLILNATIPANAYINKYNKKSMGKYQFRMIILIKEGRYKYTLTNFVHEAAKPNNGKPSRNYFEYYNSATQNVRLCDGILRFADHDIKETISRFKLSMRDPIYLDEDEW